MIPRPPSCDGPDCELSPDGWWLHYPDCGTQTEDAPVGADMAAATAREDGYSLPYGVATARTGQRSAA